MEIPDLVVPRRPASAPPPPLPEIPDLVVPPYVERLAAPRPGEPRVGMGHTEVFNLDFGECPNEGQTCACRACVMTEGMLCTCRHSFFDHHDEGCGVEGVDCDCTGFCLVAWPGGPELPALEVASAPAPPAPLPPPAQAPPRRRRRKRPGDRSPSG